MTLVRWESGDNLELAQLRLKELTELLNGLNQRDTLVVITSLMASYIHQCIILMPKDLDANLSFEYHISQMCEFVEIAMKQRGMIH